MNTINLPDDPKLAGKIVDAEASHQSQRIELGILGKLFGGKSGAAGNAASFIIYAAFIALVILLVFGSDSASYSKKDAVSSVSGLITLALGFLFGKGARD